MEEREDTPKRDDLIYDVGMHKGEDTDYYLRKGFRVVGFEADPDLAAYCRDRFSLEIGDGRLTVVEGAITELPPDASHGRTARFYRNKEVSVWGTALQDWACRNELHGAKSEVIEVPVVDFQACIREYGVPHYMKIDIEGMDKACLKALAAFEHRPDYISIESEKRSFGKLREEFDILGQLGYTRFKAVQQENITEQVEPYPGREGRYTGYRFQENCSGLFGADLPGAWMSRRQAILMYRAIFVQYRLLGERGLLRERLLGKALRWAPVRFLRGPVPGWYDTHARHRTVAP